MGSTAISNPNRPAFTPGYVHPVVNLPSDMCVPGFSIPSSTVSNPTSSLVTPSPLQSAQSAQSTQSATPSIGELLLAKDGWLKKHRDDDDDPVVGLGTTGNRRSGLGFENGSPYQHSNHSNIMQKTLDRLNKL